MSTVDPRALALAATYQAEVADTGTPRPETMAAMTRLTADLIRRNADDIACQQAARGMGEDWRIMIRIECDRGAWTPDDTQVLVNALDELDAAITEAEADHARPL